MKITRIVKATWEELGDGEVNIKIRNVKTENMAEFSSKGGRASANKLTPEQLSARGKKAVDARIKLHGK